MHDRLSFYHPTEELLNVLSHGLGLLLSIVGFSLLMFHAISIGETEYILGLGIYGLSLVVLYSASTSYHYVQKPSLRYKLNIFDHAAIYGLIAGTYTPFALLFFKPILGWTIFAIVWSVAGAGVLFKLFFTGKYNAVSTVLYVLMGWMAIFAIGPILDHFPPSGVFWIFAGGLSYTIGAVLYALKNIRFNHAIFHMFVLFGSISHFISVFYYLVPDQL